MMPVPRSPVLDWSAFSGRRDAGMPAIDALPAGLATTSGRAAIYQALLALALPAGTPVLLPTYHCPTMIAPVVLAGLTPVLYPLDEQLRPRLASMGARTPQGRAGVLLVAHYFGFARSLAEERAWCDARGLALIEDCAHCYFGHAGERPVGHWGDFAIASATKFFPVPEAGLLASAHRPVPPPLPAAGLGAQIKGLVSVLSRSQAHGRLAGPATLLRLALALRRGLARPAATAPSNGLSGSDSAPPADPLQGCDMRRSRLAPLAVAQALQRRLPRARIAARRLAHAQALVDGLQTSAGARWLAPRPTAGQAPYAMPLWLDQPDPAYRTLREEGVAVFRWNDRWRGLPEPADDFGASASHHVLQLLCHQDLRPAELRYTLSTLNRLLGRQATA